MGWIRKHWRVVVAVLGGIEPLWRILRWIVGFAGDIDFLVSRIREPAWIGDLFAFVNDLPPWVSLLLIVASASLIYWDMLRRRHTVAGSAHQPTPDQISSPAPSPSEEITELLSAIARLSDTLRHPFPNNPDPFQSSLEERMAKYYLHEIEGAVDHIYYNKNAYLIYSSLIDKFKTAIQINAQMHNECRMAELNAEIRELGTKLASILR